MTTSLLPHHCLLPTLEAKYVLVGILFIATQKNQLHTFKVRPQAFANGISGDALN